MAPWPSSTIPADAAWLRSVFWAAVLERHVAQASDRQVPRAPLDRRREDGRTQSRPDAAHDAVHRTSRPLHRVESRLAILFVRAADDAACPAACLGQAARKVAARFVRRRDPRNRLVRWATCGDARTARPDEEHAGDLRLRQRTVVDVWQSCRRLRRPARGQRNYVGWWSACSLRHVLARKNSGRTPLPRV